MRSLYQRFPQLARSLPRVTLCAHGIPPLEKWAVGDARILIKREDLNARTMGGNKVRGLELLLAGLGPDSSLLTVGSEGSTHALAVAHFGSRIGAERHVITWPQETHDVSIATSRRLLRLSRITRTGSPLAAFAKAAWKRLTAKVNWIPAGGTSPLSAIAHASAALETVEQIERQGLRTPHALVVPLGSGGTTAGILLGLSIAQSTTLVVGVRVVPGIVANRRRVLRLAAKARKLLMKRAGTDLPAVNETLLQIHDGAYGGAYARETPAATRAAALLREAEGPRLEGTYSAKALAVALDMSRGRDEYDILYWLTFDGRWLEETET